MAKRQRTNNDLQNITQKDRQYNGQKKKNKQWSTKYYTEGFVDHCLFFVFWPLYCLSFCVIFCRSLFVLFLLTIVLSVLLCSDGQKTKNKQWSTKYYTEGQTIQWSKDKEQTMSYKTLHRRTDNTMVKRKRTNNDLTIVLSVLLCNAL
jgi:hypothetical protein